MNALGYWLMSRCAEGSARGPILRMQRRRGREPTSLPAVGIAVPNYVSVRSDAGAGCR